MIDLNEKHQAWRSAYHAGELHVFRMRYVCPCCTSVWYQDILDKPDRFEIPDRRKLGLAMLCGSCEARRVTAFVVPGKDGWTAPFLSNGEIGIAWGRLNAPPKGTWISAEGLGALQDGHDMRDDRRDVFRACTTRKSEGRRINVTSMTAEQLAASGLGWNAPPPPVGNSGSAVW